jgi:hypothetical protein
MSDGPRTNKLYKDGEDIRPGDVPAIFRRPPRLPTEFDRSALIIGSRGAGKTTLFKGLRYNHSGISEIIDLSKVLFSLPKQTGRGMLTPEVPEAMERLLVGKSKSLSALAIANCSATRTLKPDISYLNACIPEVLRTHLNEPNPQVAWREVTRAPLSEFESVADAPELRMLVEDLGAQARSHGQSLLFMFDRADMVSSACLVPIFELLDQSPHFVALVAMRPSPSGLAMSEFADRIVAGDHYDLYHLGEFPHAKEWLDFVMVAVGAQLKEALGQIPLSVKDTVLALSRDSIRTAIELFTAFFRPRDQSPNAALLDAIRRMNSNCSYIVRQHLRSYHESVPDLFERLRKTARLEAGDRYCRVVLQPRLEPRPDLFHFTGKWHPFAEAGVRNSAFFLVEGDRWAPGAKIDRVELSPALVWQESDGLEIPCEPRVHSISWSESEIFGTPRRVLSPSIFVAFRMSVHESINFRQNLERAIGLHPRLARLTVKDGRTFGGQNWAEEIRKRIRGSRLAVADVTGMRPDVMFELGFAAQLQKPIIPVTDRREHRVQLPPWLTQIQMEAYHDDLDMQGLLSSIDFHLCSRHSERTIGIRKAVPELAVWLTRTNWNAHQYEQVKHAATQAGVQCELLSEPGLSDEQRIERATSACLLIVALDGTDKDTLGHFICGAIVARPRIPTLDIHRTVIVVEEPGQRKNSFVADSLRNCTGTVKVVALDNVLEVAKSTFAAIQRALNRARHATSMSRLARNGMPGETGR